MTKEEIDIIAERVSDKISYLTKTILSAEEAAQYLNIRRRTLYGWIQSSKLPYYKPNEKSLYFKKEELDEWLLRNRHSTAAEIAADAVRYCRKNKI